MSSDPNETPHVNARIPMADEGPLDARQREVLEDIVSGKRGKIVGPLRALLHSPELANRWQKLGEFLRYDTGLPPLLSELAIIMTGRYWQSQVEWVIHARVAKEAGLSGSVVEAIRTSVAPLFDDEVQFAVYEFTRELLQHGNVSDATYGKLAVHFDAESLVELSSVISYYTMVAMILNVHQVPVPSDEKETRLPSLATNHLPKLESLPKARITGIA